MSPRTDKKPVKFTFLLTFRIDSFVFFFFAGLRGGAAVRKANGVLQE